MSRTSLVIWDRAGHKQSIRVERTHPRLLGRCQRTATPPARVDRASGAACVALAVHHRHGRRHDDGERPAHENSRHTTAGPSRHRHFVYRSGHAHLVRNLRHRSDACEGRGRSLRHLSARGLWKTSLWWLDRGNDRPGCAQPSQDPHYAGAKALRAACSRTLRTCSIVTPSNASTYSVMDTSDSRFSNNDDTGTRVPRKTHPPL